MPFEIGNNSNTVKMILAGLAVIGTGYVLKNSDKIGKSMRKTTRKRSKSRRKTKTPSTPRNSRGQLQMV